MWGGGKREKLPYVYRGMIPYESEEKTKILIRKKYLEAKRVGYKLKPVVYITKKILKNEGKNLLFLDIRIPVEE